MELFVRFLMDLTRRGFAGLYTVAFYWVQVSIVWSLVMVGMILMENVGERGVLNVIT